MTRGNLNFVWQNIGEAPRTLFHYHNGDQYPEGLLQWFGIEEFLTIDRPWNPDDFRSWIRENYRKAGRQITKLGNGLSIDAYTLTDEPAEAEDFGEGGQPKVYYTDGFVTDYSYVFTLRYVHGRRKKDGTRPCHVGNWVTAWNFEKLIFNGTARQFLKFCRKRVRAKILPGDQAAFSAAGTALKAALG